MFETTFLEEFRSEAVKRSESLNPDECWPWSDSAVRNNRYGSIQRGRLGNPTYKYGQAHVMSYWVFKGSTSEGMHILHTCDNKWCFNPNHLYAGTRLDNARDAKERGQYTTVAQKVSAYRTGRTLPPNTATCDVEGCTSTTKSRKQMYCGKHYQRARRGQALI